MKRTAKVEDNRSFIKLEAENGAEYSFSYRLDSVPFMGLLALFSSINQKKVESDPEKQAGKFLEIFNGLKNVIGKRTYQEIIDWTDENDEEISLEEWVSLIISFEGDQEDLPKKSSSS